MQIQFLFIMLKILVLVIYTKCVVELVEVIKRLFCYFITPPLTSISDDSRKRIKAIEEYSELGSGIKIAMKDLEIRGAGNLLGAEQSGFINNIGFETYQKILKEAISELSNKEFKNLKIESNSLLDNLNDTNIETDFSAMIPDDYVNIFLKE